MSPVALLLLLFVFLQLSLMLLLPLLLLKKKFSLPLLLNTGDNDDEDDDENGDANRVLRMLRGVVIGASAARVVVDTVAVVDVDDLDRSLPSIVFVCNFLFRAQKSAKKQKVTLVSFLCACRAAAAPQKKVHTFFSTLFARTKEKQLIRSLFLFLSLSLSIPLSARARVCVCRRRRCCSLASSSSSSGENVEPKRRRCCGRDNLASPNFPPEVGRLREAHAETVPSENAERNAGREILEEL
jgi:hypothetical protein